MSVEAFVWLRWSRGDVLATLHADSDDVELAAADGRTVADALAALAVAVEAMPEPFALDPCPHEDVEREDVDPDEHPTLTALYCTACGARVGS